MTARARIPRIPISSQHALHASLAALRAGHPHATDFKESTMIRHLVAALFAAFALNAWAAVDVNQASRAELETVKGIGPGLSGKILEARKTGAFKSWDDLVERVGGVGPGNAARFSKAGLTVGTAAYDGKAAGAPAKPGKTPRDAKSRKAEAAGKEQTTAAQAH
jgi:competence protein ComEA